MNFWYDKKELNSKVLSKGFVFDAGKLQDPELYSKDFALFLYELNHLRNLGCNWHSIIEYNGSEVRIVYFLPINSFSVITSMVDDWLAYSKKKDTYSVFAREEFEHQFEADLQLHTANIKEEIKIYGK